MRFAAASIATPDSTSAPIAIRISREKSSSDSSHPASMGPEARPSLDMKPPRVARRPDASSRERMPNRYGTTNDQLIAARTLALKSTGPRPPEKKPPVPASESHTGHHRSRAAPKRGPHTTTRPDLAAPRPARHPEHRATTPPTTARTPAS